MLKGIRAFAAAVISVMLLFSLLSCAKREETDISSSALESSTAENSVYPYTFLDSTGAEVTLEKKPEKIAVLFSSYAEIWTLAGGSIDITVGESIERGFADKDTVLVDEKTGHSEIDMETLVAEKPDFVIGTADYECQNEAVLFCREHDIPAAAFKVESAEEYAKALRIFCDILENDEAYTEYGEKVLKEIDELLEKVDSYVAKNSLEAKKILFVRAGSSEKSTKAKNSTDNFVCAMLSELNTLNIADADTELTGALSAEAILLFDPEYLFITTMGDEDAAKEYMNSLIEMPEWQALTCIENNSYTYLSKDMFHFKPNQRWADAYRFLIGILYPEVNVDKA